MTGFWKFTSNYTSHVTKILERDDFTLEDILDEAETIPELLASNAKLVEYLREDEVLEALTDYVVEDDDYQLKYEEELEKERQGQLDVEQQKLQNELNDVNDVKDNKVELDNQIQSTEIISNNNSNTNTDTNDHDVNENEVEHKETSEKTNIDETETDTENRKDLKDTENQETIKVNEDKANEKEEEEHDDDEDDEEEEEEEEDDDERDEDDDEDSYDNVNMNDEDDEDDENREETPAEIHSRRAQVAAEILSVDVWSLTDAFMDKPHLLEKLWGILDKPSPLPIFSATYFMKINEHLLDMKMDEMIQFILHQPKLVERFIRHIDTPPLMDFLLKVLSTDKQDNSTGVIDILKDQDLIPSLIDYLGPEVPSSVQSAAGDFLKAFITISANNTDNSTIGPNELSRQLVSEPMVRKLVDMMLHGGTGLSNGVGIVIEIIRKNNSDYDFVPVLYITIESHPPTPRDPIYLGTLVKVFSEALPKFTDMLERKESKVLETPFGQIEPLGFERFKICELIAELLHCSNMALLNDEKGEEIVRERDEVRESLIQEHKKLLNQNYLQNLNEDDDEITDDNTHQVDDNDNDNDHDENNENESNNTNSNANANSNATTTNNNNENSEITTNEIELSKDNNSESLANENTDEELSNKVSDLKLTDNDENDGKNEKNEDNENNENSNSDNNDDGANNDEEVETGNTTAVDPNGDDVEKSLRKNPVVGDLLKIALYDNNIIITILNMFFHFPWNNFLHNVVFDIVQQVLNGSLDIGYNKYLAIDLFDRGKITQLIIDGQNRCQDYEEQTGLRLGYMGHLTLIAEEVVKFTTFYLAQAHCKVIEESVSTPEWLEYVSETLVETRNKYNAVLGESRLDNCEEEEGDEDDDEDDDDEDDEDRALDGYGDEDEEGGSRGTGNDHERERDEDEDDDEILYAHDNTGYHQTRNLDPAVDHDLSLYHADRQEHDQQEHDNIQQNPNDNGEEDDEDEEEDEEEVYDQKGHEQQQQQQQQQGHSDQSDNKKQKKIQQVNGHHEVVEDGDQFSRYMSQQMTSDLPDKFASSSDEDDEDDEIHNWNSYEKYVPSTVGGHPYHQMDTFEPSGSNSGSSDDVSSNSNHNNGDDDDYEDPNDDGLSYAKDNHPLYANDGSLSNRSNSTDAAGAGLDDEDNLNLSDDVDSDSDSDLDPVDEDIEEADNSLTSESQSRANQLVRSASKGHMIRDDEEDDRLITMANYMRRKNSHEDIH